MIKAFFFDLQKISSGASRPKDIPQTLKPHGKDGVPKSIDVRGEVYMERKAFQEAAERERDKALAIVVLARRLVQGSDLGSTGGGHAAITCDEEPYAALAAIFEAEREAERLIPGLVCAECDRPIYKGQEYGGKGGHAAHKACRNWPKGTALKVAGTAQEGPAS